MLPRALGHRYIHASSAQRFTVQSDWKLGPLFGVLALLGGLETCYVIGKNDLTRKKKAVTQANGIFAKESHILVNDKPELTKKNEAVMQTNDVSPEAIQYALDQAKGQPFLKDNEEKMAYFKQQISQCHALCRDGSFLQTLARERWLTASTRIEEDRSSNMPAQGVEGLPFNGKSRSDHNPRRAYPRTRWRNF